MTAKKHILAFEIGTFFTHYVVFEDGHMGINYRDAGGQYESAIRHLRTMPTTNGPALLSPS